MSNNNLNFIIGLIIIISIIILVLIIFSVNYIFILLTVFLLIIVIVYYYYISNSKNNIYSHPNNNINNNYDDKKIHDIYVKFTDNRKKNNVNNIIDSPHDKLFERQFSSLSPSQSGNPNLNWLIKTPTTCKEDQAFCSVYEDLRYLKSNPNFDK